MLQSLEKYLDLLFERIKPLPQHLENSLLIKNMAKINYIYMANDNELKEAINSNIAEDILNQLHNRIFVINSPFENIWIEFKHGLKMPLDPLPLKGLGFFETSTGFQINAISYTDEIAAEFNFETKGGIVIQIFDSMNKNGKREEVEREFLAVVLSYIFAAKTAIEKINNRNIHYITNTEKVKVKGRLNGKFTKYKYNPEHVIYISSEKEIKKNESIVKRIIKKPDFAYEVMGHWRRLNNPNTLGKNRQGEYCVEGRTWVRDFIKGSGELKKRVRVCVG